LPYASVSPAQSVSSRSPALYCLRM
jgi:hypothetical protein